MELLPFSALTPSQLAEVVAIYRDAFEAPWEWSSDRIVELAHEGATPAGEYTLAFVDGDAAIGLAVASYLSGANLSYLRYLAIAPARRGAGAGAVLLRAARAASEKWAQAIGLPGCRGMLAEVEMVDGPPVTADLTLRQRRIAFYRRQGAVHTGVRVPRPPWSPPEMPEWEIMLLPGAAWTGSLDGAVRGDLCRALMVEGYAVPADTPWLQAWLNDNIAVLG